ncbi:MAG: hypothetical protein MZV63_22260 [Marinilabiliales bacterium]|nr:hypothetical protein [Marinilabiliales bacterium]
MELLSFASLIELELDFSEEDVQLADRFAMTETVIMIKSLVDSLACVIQAGQCHKERHTGGHCRPAQCGQVIPVSMSCSRRSGLIVSDIPGTDP